MKYVAPIFLLLFFVAVFSIYADAQIVSSPNGNVKLEFKLDASGTPIYTVNYGDRQFVRESRLGFDVKAQPPLKEKFHLIVSKRELFDQEWKPVWGEVQSIRNNYNELLVMLEQDVVGVPSSMSPEGLFVSAEPSNMTGEIRRRMNIRFRVFNDGVGFRYEFPEQDQLKYFQITAENTEINMSGDHKTFWIPGDYDTNEYAYFTTRLSEIDAYKGKNATEIGTRVLFADNAVQTPLMMKSADGLYVNIHEAALNDYPAMYLLIDRKNFGLQTHLAPNAVGSAAFMQTPAKTPWRTIVVSDKATEILSSKLILNLNEPTAATDTKWIKPQKMIGVWWEMHIGTASWNYSDARNVKIGETDFNTLTPNLRHGANNPNVRRYIDFAAANGFNGVLVEGWNVGWEDWYGNWKENVFDFVTPYPDFDIKALNDYAKTKGVKLIMHHETSSSAGNYERRLSAAFDLMSKYGYDTVKTGYVGRIIPRGEFHDGQTMVNHYNFVVSEALKRKIMVDSHESVRPTGLHRTFPNWLASEAARGNEFNAWSVGNPPEHETILPFTRLMGGPMDYTPGIFEVKMSKYTPGSTNQVHTTLAKQLALYVTIYSPLQMAADLPENYEARKDAFQFIKDVAIDWDDTRILEAEPGDFVTIARKAKGTENWFIGAITDEQARTANIALDFLNPEKDYIATVYADGIDADWKENPMSYEITKFAVKKGSALSLQLANGGGAAISVTPATPAQIEELNRAAK